MCVLSRFHDKAKRSTGVGLAVTSVNYRNLSIDSQRGRLPKGH